MDHLYQMALSIQVDAARVDPPMDLRQPADLPALDTLVFVDGAGPRDPMR